MDNTFRWIELKTQAVQTIVCVQVSFDWRIIRKFYTELESDIVVRTQNFLGKYSVERQVIREKTEIFPF